MKNTYLLPVVSILLGITCLIIHAKTSGVTADGFLVEPFFFLVPSSYLLFLIGIISISFVIMRSFLRKNK